MPETGNSQPPRPCRMWAMSKTNPGNFFEDFKLGQVLEHATPRTVTEGDRALYGALYPTRFALPSSAEFAAAVGLSPAPVEDLIAFHIAFGKTVPDISLNAVANLGYAELRFHRPVVPGDTLSTRSEVIGLKENSNGKSGVVYVRSTATNQRGEVALDWARWVMVHKRDHAAPAPETVLPELASVVAAQDLVIPEGLDFSTYDFAAAGEPHRLRGLCGRREDRPRRRCHAHRRRAHARHPAVAEHRQGALQRRGAAPTATG